MYSITTATTKIMEMSKRIRGVAGGTSAGKTISILFYLISAAQSDNPDDPTITTIGAESMPHLRRGAIRDFKKIMQQHGYWKQDNWRKAEKTYTFETGSQIEFLALDEPDKFRGGRRQRLYINECNNIPYAAFEQLQIRTTEYIFLDWNPSEEFWFYTKIKDKEDVEFLTLTYKDNEALDPRIVQAIEAKKDNARWWRVYGLGLLGEAEGRVFTGWNIVSGIPEEARLVRRGLDFGYTNDPTAIVDIYEYQGGILLDERCYQVGLMNRQIADILQADPNIMTVGDSSEPKSIDEIKEAGILIVPAVKGKGSVKAGIDYLQSINVWVTSRSTNVLKEYRNYMWTRKKHDEGFINEPQDLWNHAMDAIRYGAYGYKSGADYEEYEEDYETWTDTIGI